MWAQAGTLSGKGLFMTNGTGSAGYALGQGLTNGDTAGSRLWLLYGNVGWLDCGWDFPNTTNLYHIVVTRGAASSNQPRVYINGALVTSIGDATAPLAPVTSAALGRDEATNNRRWAGTLDEAAMYTTALSAARIAAHYAAAFPSGYSLQEDSIGRFLLEDGSGFLLLEGPDPIRIPIDVMRRPLMPALLAQ